MSERNIVNDLIADAEEWREAIDAMNRGLLLDITADDINETIDLLEAAVTTIVYERIRVANLERIIDDYFTPEQARQLAIDEGMTT